MVLTKSEKALVVGSLIVKIAFFIGLLYFVGQGILFNDSDSNLLFAQNMLYHHVFSESTSTPFLPSSINTPGYPFFLVLTGLMTHWIGFTIILQIILVTIATVLLYRMLANIFSERVAFWGALVFAIEPWNAFATSFPLTEATFLFCLISAFYLLQRALVEERRALFFASGLLFGLAALVRPIAEYLPLLLVLFLFIFYRRFSLTLRQVGSAVVLLLVGGFLVLTPWMARNYAEFHTFSLATKGPYTVYFYDVLSLVAYRDHISNEQANDSLYTIAKRDNPGVMTQADLMNPIYARYLDTQSLKEIEATPTLYAKLYLTSIATFFFSDGYRLILKYVGVLDPNLPNVTFLIVGGKFSLLFQYLRNDPLAALSFFAGSILWACTTILSFAALPLAWLREKDSRRRAWVYLFVALLAYFALLTGLAAQARYRVVVTPFLFALAVYSLNMMGRRRIDASGTGIFQRMLIACYRLINKTGLLHIGPLRNSFNAMYFWYKRHSEDSYIALLRDAPEVFTRGHILDVGANIGYTATLFAGAMSPGYRLYAFEPEEKNFVSLASTLERPPYAARSVPVRVLVGATSADVAELWVNPAHAGDHRIMTETFRGEGEQPVLQEVPMVSLDDFSQKELRGEPVSFIKIDVQGYESEVCKGMRRLLADNPQTVVGLEYYPLGIRTLGFDERDILNFFREKKYLMYTLGREKGLMPADYDTLDTDLQGAAYMELIFSKEPIKKRGHKSFRYYYRDIAKLVAYIIPAGSSVLEMGQGTGDALLESVRVPKTESSYDYVFMLDAIGSMRDIGEAFAHAKRNLSQDGRLVVTFHNFLWEPIFAIAEKLKLKAPSRTQNWISPNDVKNLLFLAGFDVVRSGKRMLFPVYVPLLSAFLNALARLPLINKLSITNYIIARPLAPRRDYSVSIIVPARNEKGNIQNIIDRTPHFGLAQELIFIEGHSKDGTWEEIERATTQYRGPMQIKMAKQTGIGKGDAVRLGFDMASNEVLMILDADMTVAPEDLPKFYEALAQGKADFINGSRLVYPMEEQAMRFLNTVANKCFAILFTWLLDQQIKDTLCGTKVLRKVHYEQIARNRIYFGDFDPFGDYDLLFGAVKQNLKIVDLPIRYRQRLYGTTQIHRWTHGWLLLKMCVFAARKIKFN